MKKIIVIFVIALSLVSSPVFVSASTQTVDNSALIEQLLKIVVGLQKQPTELIAQRHNNAKGQNNTCSNGAKNFPQCNRDTLPLTSAKYHGSSYGFSYPSDWDVREINSLLGSTIIFPKSKTDQYMNKAISTTN